MTKNIILEDQKNFKDIIDDINEINFDESIIRIEKNIALQASKELYSHRIARDLCWKPASAMIMQKCNTDIRLLTYLMKLIDNHITNEINYTQSNLLMEVLIYNLSTNNKLFLENSKYTAAANIYEPTLDTIKTANIRDILINILSASKEDLEKELYNNIMGLEYVEIKEENFTIPQRYDGLGELLGDKNFPICSFNVLRDKLIQGNASTFDEIAKMSNMNIYVINMCYGISDIKICPIYHPEIIDTIKKLSDAIITPNLISQIKLIEQQSGIIEIKNPHNFYEGHKTQENKQLPEMQYQQKNREQKNNTISDKSSEDRYNIVILNYGRKEESYDTDDKVFMLLHNKEGQYLLKDFEIYFINYEKNKALSPPSLKASVLDDVINTIKHNEFIKKYLEKKIELKFNFIKFKDLIKSLKFGNIPLYIENKSDVLDKIANYIISEFNISTNYMKIYARTIGTKIYNDLILDSSDDNIEEVFNTYFRDIEI